MRRLLIIFAACGLLIGWLAYPYLTIGDIHGASTRPAALAQLGHSNPLRQIHGQAGFWRLGQDEAGVWWWVSPTGKLEFLNTVTTVQPEQDGRDRNSVRYVSTDWNGRYDSRDLDRWASETLSRVVDYGFKGLAPGAIPPSIRSTFP